MPPRSEPYPSDAFHLPLARTSNQYQRDLSKVKIRLDISKLGVCTGRINAGDHALPPGISIIQRRAESIPQRKIEAYVPDVRQTAGAPATSSRVPERRGLKGASPRIPKVLVSGRTERVHFAPRHHSTRKSEDRCAIKVFVILH